MANRYWIGGTGTWTDTAHWSTSDGGSGGATVPTSSDSVFFTVNSYNNNYTVTMTTGANCLDMTWANPSSGKPTMAGSNISINIYGSLTLVASMGLTFYGGINFLATSSKNITTAGNTWISGDNFTFNGSGGTWVLQDNLTFADYVTSITITNGTFNTSGKTVTVGSVYVNGGTITLGTSTINCLYQWNYSSGTVNANTSSIVVTAHGYFSGGGKTYYNMSINNYYTFGVSQWISITGTNTFNNLTLTNATYPNDGFDIFDNQTVNGTLTIAGNSASNRLWIYGGRGMGTAVTFALGTTGTANLSNCDFMDITITGTNAPISGGGIASYGETNYNTYYQIDATNPDTYLMGEVFNNIVADTLNGCKFYLFKSGTPTGNIHAALYAVTGTYGSDAALTGSALATSDAFDVSTLTGSPQLISFSFSGYSLAANTNYAIVVDTTGSTSNSSNCINIGVGGNGYGYSGNVTYENQY